MGITRDSNHKRRNTGGKKHLKLKKRKHNLGRQPSNTRIGPRNVTNVRVRGGNVKKRALFTDTGNFSMVSLGKSHKSKIISVAYNLSNNELARTNTLVKGCIVQIDATPFKHYANEIKSSYTKKNSTKLDKNLIDQFISGRILARVCSRPGQCGRADGYILEKAELDYYIKKTTR